MPNKGENIEGVPAELQALLDKDIKEKEFFAT